MSDFDAAQIDLAKRIAAAKSGAGPMPSDDELRAAIDAIRIRRAEYVQTRKRAAKDPAATGGKATVATIDLDNLGI